MKRKKMIKYPLKKLILSCLVWLAVLQPAIAGELQKEIDYLIASIKSSNCLFIRNGSEHSPEAASSHILKKYDYYKEKIKTAEDFIELCATQSTMTKKLYEMKCGEMRKVETRDWLMAALHRYRKNSQ